MSSKKKPVKKVVVAARKDGAKKEKLKPTSSKGRGAQQQKVEDAPLIFGWANYKFMLIGIGLIALGMILMLGGAMPSPDVWDENLIYSFRRTVLAPFLIVAGLLVEVYAIFKKS